MKDVTDKYKGMIQAFSCDFSLAEKKETPHGLDELQLKIEQGDKRLLADIELLRSLDLGIRIGRIKIFGE